jgi:peptidoglycan/LPS O-acetylase OafA/YrhL
MGLFRYLASPWTDPDRKRSAHGDSMFALDGIRGLAVCIVLASHTNAVWMAGQGSLGVLLFFALSGFVLTLPFADQPARILRWAEVWRFFVNRALRIVPIYVVAVLYIRWLSPETWTWFFDNVTFRTGWTYFWSVAEEARFYALFPVIIAALALLPARGMRIVALIIMTLTAWQVQNWHTIDMMMTGQRVAFYFWIFLAGALACMLYRPLRSVPDIWIWRRCAGAAALAIIVLMPFSTDAAVQRIWRPIFPTLPVDFEANGWAQPEIWCALFVILLLGVTVFQRSIISRLMRSWPMRHLGLLSYSLYLFHVPVIIALERHGSEDWLLLKTLAGTYVIAILSYLTVEKPFLMLKPMGARR